LGALDLNYSLSYPPENGSCSCTNFNNEPLSYYISKIGDVFVKKHITTTHVEDIGHEVSTSFSHEDKGSVTYNSFKNSDFGDIMVNLESVVF
jgi:hypothetical protein